MISPKWQSREKNDCMGGWGGGTVGLIVEVLSRAQEGRTAKQIAEKEGHSQAAQIIQGWIDSR